MGKLKYFKRYLIEEKNIVIGDFIKKLYLQDLTKDEEQPIRTATLTAIEELKSKLEHRDKEIISSGKKNLLVVV